MEAINARLDAVEELLARPGLASFRADLQGKADLERALGRVRNAAAPVAQGLPAFFIQAAQQRCAMVIEMQRQKGFLSASSSVPQHRS